MWRSTSEQQPSADTIYSSFRNSRSLLKSYPSLRSYVCKLFREPSRDETLEALFRHQQNLSLGLESLVDGTHTPTEVHSAGLAPAYCVQNAVAQMDTVQHRHSYSGARSGSRAMTPYPIVTSSYLATGYPYLASPIATLASFAHSRSQPYWREAVQVWTSRLREGL